MSYHKKLRLVNRDYSQDGMYFITVCVRYKNNLLWTKESSPLRKDSETAPMSETGIIVDAAIQQISHHYAQARVDQYVIMPNHIHLILVLQRLQTEDQSKAFPTVSRIVKQMKEYTTKQAGFAFWQKSFYDHIIRNHEDYQLIRNYIRENPLKWEEDCFYTGLE